MTAVNPFTTLYPVGAVIRSRENGCTAAIASEPKACFLGARRMEAVQVLFYGDTPEQSHFVSIPTKFVLKRYEPTGVVLPASEAW